MSRLVEDETWAVLTLWMEARGEPYDGKLAVAEVIQERMRRKYQSDGTVVGTVLKPYQFSGWNTHDVNRLAAARLEEDDAMAAMCRQAWRDVQAGFSVVPRAVLYCNPDVLPQLPEWATPAKLVRIVGRHHFFLA